MNPEKALGGKHVVVLVREPFDPDDFHVVPPDSGEVLLQL